MTLERGDASELDVSTYVQLLSQHKYLIYSFVLLGVLVGAGLFTLEDELYVAEGRLIIQPDSFILDQDKVGIPLSLSRVDDHLLVLEAVEDPKTIKTVMYELGIENRSIILPLSDQIKQSIRNVLTREQKEVTLEDRVKYYRSSLRGRSFKAGEIVTITATLPDPELASELVNTMGEHAISAFKQLKKRKSQSSIEVIDEQITKIADQLEDLNIEIATLKNNPEYITYESLSKKIASHEALIATLESSLAELRAKDAELSAQDVSESVVKDRVGVNSKINSFKDRIELLEADKIESEKQLAVVNSTPYQKGQELKFFAAQNEAIFKALIQQKQKYLLQQTDTSKNVVWLNKADPSAVQRVRKGVTYFVLSVLLGFAVAVGLIIATQSLKPSFDSKDHIEKMLDQPVIGAIPMISPKTEEQLLKGEALDSNIFEAYQSLRTNIHFAREKGAVKTISFVAAQPNEGKTLNGLNLAIILSKSGEKVLLIDANFRSSKVKKYIEVGGKGLVAINQTKSMRELGTTVMKNLDVIPVGETGINPQNFVESPTFTDFLKDVAQKYDQVIVDTSPYLHTSETSLLVKRTDATVLIVDTKVTKRKEARQVIEDLQKHDVRLLGVLINERNW